MAARDSAGRNPEQRAGRFAGRFLDVHRLLDPAHEDGALSKVRFDPTHPYVETCWLPVIGPSATWCLRRLALELESHPEGVTLDLAILGQDLGLKGALSRNAPMPRTLARLCDFGLARFVDDAEFEVRTELPPLTTRGLGRLSPRAAAVHRQMVAEASNPLLSAALSYVRHGWPVLPLRRGEKIPDGRLVPHGLNDATIDEARVRAWWAASPHANVGIRTGTGLDVVDLDSPAAHAALFDAAPEALETIVVKTARGRHLWFASSGLSSRAGVLEGVDVRGWGGYVVAPPSVHPDGWRYQFLGRSSGELRAALPDRPLSPVPAWLLDRLRPSAREAPRRTEPVRLSSSHYVGVAVESECAAVAATPEGSRNHRLNAAAFSLGTLVGAQVLDVSDARAHLLDAALRAGLGEREALSTIVSGLTAGERQPRQLAEPTPTIKNARPGHERRPLKPAQCPDDGTAAAVLARARRAESAAEEDGPFGRVEPLEAPAHDELDEVPGSYDDAVGSYCEYEEEWPAGAAVSPLGLEQ